jgi:isopenicillin-N epimerase
VIGWGFGDNRKLAQNSDYVDALQWLGTSDPAAYLAVPAAIAFQQEHDWPRVRAERHRLLAESLSRVSELTGLAPLYTSVGQYAQMAVNALPRIDDLTGFNRRLFDRHRVEIPCIEWNGRQFLRIALQGYNTRADIDALLAALAAELPG